MWGLHFFIAFHGVLFVQFFASDPVGFSCQYECLHLVNHWFLSLQSPLYSCPSVSCISDEPRNDVQRSGQHLVAVHHVVVQLHDFLGLGMDVCHIQLIGECIAVKKSLQNCPTCPIVPLSQQEMVFLSKLLYINILSFLLHLFFVIWDNGTLGQVGQVVQFCKEFYSLFPLSLAISLRSTLTISLVIIAILFSRTGKELCRIQLVGDVQSLEKALQNCLNCLNCLTVSLSQVELVILSKLLYINILSFLLQLLFIL